jgi:hypothetical protein
MEQSKNECMVKFLKNYQVLIHEQLGISKEGAVIATNATFE